MKLSKYGITLNRLTENKIELVRTWRNDPKIAHYMEFRDFISPEMQIIWFQLINNDRNYYFIIEYEQKEIGLINVRDIDLNLMEGEGGIFIYDDNYLNSDVSFRATLCLTDFCFEFLKLKLMKAHILSTNKRAISFNKFLGFKKAENQDNILNQMYYLTPQDYFNKKKIIIKLF